MTFTPPAQLAPPVKRGSNTRNTTTTAMVNLRLIQDETGMAYSQGIFLLLEDGQWRVCE
jgi:hypothetical protein